MKRKVVQPRMDVNSNLWNDSVTLTNQNGQLIITDICRICGSSEGELLPIYEGEGLLRQLAPKIQQYLPIKMFENDSLPKQVCYKCASTIVAWHDMTVRCVKVEEKFHDILRSLKLQSLSKCGDNQQDGCLQELPDNFCGSNRESSAVENCLQEENEILEPDVESCSARSLQSCQGCIKPLQKCNCTEWKVNKEDRLSLFQISPSIYSEDAACSTCSETVEKCQCYKDELMSKTDLEGDVHCDKCKKSFKHDQELHTHMRCHQDEVDTTACTESSEKTKIGFTAQNATADTEYLSIESPNQMSVKSPNSEFSCCRCLKIFVANSDLEKHSCVEGLPERLNADDINNKKGKGCKIFPCNICKKKFRLKNNYLRHYRIHTGERPFTCHVCGKQFRVSGSLQRHLRDVHAKIKNFGCDICGRYFAAKETRDDHRRIHTGERPFVCASCGKTFKSKASLWIHSRIHMDLFPHACSYCPKRFKRRSQLIPHLVTHTGEKPYICETCGKSFGVKCERTRHMRIHLKPYVCTVCGLKFAQPRDIKKHVKVHES